MNGNLCSAWAIPARSYPHPRECSFLVARAEISNGAALCGAGSRTTLLPSTSDGSNDMTM
jgi:hypothetical protein